MAIAFVFESSELNQHMYDGLMEGIGRREVTAELPPGIIAHFAGPTENGWRVVDVWEDEESAGRFYESDTFQTVVGGGPQITTQPWPLYRIEVAKTTAQKG